MSKNKKTDMIGHNTKMEIQYLDPCSLKDYERQFRKPNKNQIIKSQRLLEEFGFPIPAVIDDNLTIVIGWHLVQAARQLKWKVNRPMDVVVLNDCVTLTNVTLCSSKISTSFEKSVRDRVRRSILYTTTV